MVAFAVCFGIAAIAVGRLLLWRNDMVCKVRLRVNQECHDEAIASITGGQDVDIDAAWGRYNRLGSYENMLFKQWKKWNYDQFTRGL